MVVDSLIFIRRYSLQFGPKSWLLWFLHPLDLHDEKRVVYDIQIFEKESVNFELFLEFSAEVVRDI